MDTSATRLPVVVQFISQYLPYFRGEIAVFAAKALIAASVTLATFAIGAHMLASAVDSALQRTMERARVNFDNTVQRTLDGARDRLTAELPKVRAAIQNEMRIGGRGFWTKLEDELDRLAKSDDPPLQKKQKVLSDIRIISQKWRPFLVEAATAVTESEVADRNNRSTSVDR